MKTTKTSVRILACLLALCMTAGLLPGMALAAYTEERIDAVSVSVTAPAAGALPAEPAVAADAPYTLEFWSWEEVASIGSDANVGYMYLDTTFAASRCYCLEVELRAAFGYAFDTARAAAQVDGAASVKITRINEDKLTLSAWFTVPPSPTPEEIAEIVITGVTKPSDATKDPLDTMLDVEKNAGKPEGTVLDGAYYEWKPAAEGGRSDGWEYLGYGDSFTDGGLYGARLELTADNCHSFADTVTATVDGKPAIVLEKSKDTVALFVLFAESIEIRKLRVTVFNWPANGAAIRNTPANFDFYSSMYGCTLDATFQIEQPDGSWRDVTDADSPFQADAHYRVKAVICAADGFAFAASGTGSINGESGTTWDVSDGGKTLTMTRTCGKEGLVYSYVAGDTPETYLYDVLPIRILTPADGVIPEDATVGRPGESRWTEGLSTKYAGWYEVPYAGSLSKEKSLYDTTQKKFTKPFQDGKVYRMDVSLRANSNSQFIGPFSIELYGTDGALLTPVMTRQTTDAATWKEYSFWFEVGEVSYQKIPTLTVTGPEVGADGKIDVSDPTQFTAREAVTLSGIQYVEYFDELMFEATVQAGYYFAAPGQLRATYNGHAASVSGVYWGDSRELLRVTFRVSTTKTPLTIKDPALITAKGKTYDGTAAAELDISHAALSGVEDGDDVQLVAAEAAFASADAGADVAVSVTGMFALTGEHAGKYTLTQPELHGLTATIAPCTLVADTTNRSQTVYTGEGTFDGAHFAGVEVGGTPEAATGVVRYTIGEDTEEKTGEEIAAYLKTLKAGDMADIHYNFDGTGNYDGALASGVIKITVADRPAAPVTPAQPKITEKNCPKDGTCPLTRFADVPNNAWYHDALHYCVEHGLLSGTGESTFSPGRTMTRGMVVTVLHRLAGSPAPKGTAGFEDVAAGSYCDAATRWAAENGIVLGFASGKFEPEQPVTRAQLAVILCRYAALVGLDVTNMAELDGFADADAVGEWAREALGWASGAGIILGGKDGRIAPQGDATRAQTAVILYRFCTKLLGK